MQGKRVLVIDDDPEVLRLMERIFAQAHAQVTTAISGQEGLHRLYQVKPDLIILDIMMPIMDGWRVCRQVREVSNVPIIMLTALGQDQDMIHGLDCGADDYLIKPVRPEVLLARARAVLRRSVSYFNGRVKIYHDGYLLIDLEQRRVQAEGRPVKLSATEYKLLAYMVQHTDRVLTFDQILDHVWGEECRDRVEYVHVYMSRVRRKLEPDPDHPQYLLSEHGVGYTFQGYPNDPTR
jgi:two-component system KDP operon response regulator KdpE